MDSFKKNVEHQLKKSGLTIASAEKKAGLSVSTLHSILSGRSKKPSIETIVALSNLFHCSMEELLFDESKEESRFLPIFIDPNKLSKEMDFDLFLDVVNSLKGYSLKNTLHLQSPTFFQIALEIYYYFLGKKMAIDPDFIRITVEKYHSSKK